MSTVKHTPKYLFPGGIVNARTGKPIPPDEPVFLLRAQDALAVKALQGYLWAMMETKLLGEDAAFKSVYEHMNAFLDWPIRKLPD